MNRPQTCHSVILMSPRPEYAKIINDSIAARRVKNPSYSMRAFSRESGISSAFLSQCLQGKRSPSEDMAHRIASALKFDAEKRAIFINSVRCSKARTSIAIKSIRSEVRQTIKGRQFRSIATDGLDTTEHWLGPALLELLNLNESERDLHWICKKLGKTTPEIESVLRKLLRQKLIHVQNGVYSRVEEPLTTPFISSESIRRYHASILDKARESIQSQKIGERDLSTITIATSPELIQQAALRIQNFRREMMEFLESGEKNCIYALNINLFRLDKKDS
jgi:uncharacterized protein (TIGR02147 family)